ncbi:GDSL-type esterase/lipase family protein [Curtobacterium sp. VKM Ac-2852]|uniref:GDSL-type esterase/lipase family protein n=1 Tax=Curtobacterium sp. VKM Ac-2852 TaxID=2739024 RepID=UPI0015653E20|nr:GDSL-type esterase/lipase family protein [Curtobacterium sp. VKM Ac-2852]NQX23313.1 hypothetical protein [Curtobacterium sp. VKM Ac-2852]
MGTNLLPSVDSDTLQLPDEVRARITANLGDVATPEGAEVAARFGPVAAARPGNRMVWLGDSLTQWQDAATPANTATSSASHSQRVSLGNLASIMTGQRALYVNNAGIGGNTTAQMLARFDSDVTPYAPNVVHLLAGTNDIGNSVPLATSIDNIAKLVAKIRRIGAVPILGLLPPSAASPAKVTQWNMAIRRYALAQGVALVDYHTPLVDPATGSFLPAYLGDGTHPSSAGFGAMAQAFAATAGPLLPPFSPSLPTTNAQSNNLLGNGLFPGVGSPWTGSPQSVSAAATPAVGNWMNLTADGSASGTIYQNVPTAPVPGHRYMLVGRVQTTLTSGTSGFLVRNRITTASGAVDMMPMNNIPVVIPDGVFFTEYVCPDGATAQQVMFQINSGMAGTMKIAQVALYDLTALGVV